jgi:photosystem II stability/assembly factor-like uncharacterized protein
MMTRKKSDCAMTRCFYPVILLLSAMTIVRGSSWASSSPLASKTGFDYVAAVWSSSTTCVTVGNSARNGAIQRTTDSGITWTDVTPIKMPNLLNDIAHFSFQSNSHHLVTGTSSSSPPNGYVFTSPDGITFSTGKLVSTTGLNGVAIGSNGYAYVVGVEGKIFNSVSGVDWSSWNDVTPASNSQVMQNRRCYAIHV